jgi:hypothetical protein
MNKWQIICPLTLLALIGVLAMRSQLVTERHVMASAVTRQLDGHSSEIATLLDTMHTNQVVEIEDAVYQELQRPPLTSLIARSNICVTRTTNGLLKCTVDTSEEGVPPRTIGQARTNYPTPSTRPRP